MPAKLTAKARIVAAGLSVAAALVATIVVSGSASAPVTAMASPALIAASEAQLASMIADAQSLNEPIAAPAVRYTKNGIPIAPSGTAKASDVLVGEAPSTDLYALLTGGATTFTTSSVQLPKAATAVERAMASVGNAASVCTDKACFQLCDHVAGHIWGYEFASGYQTASAHWAAAVTSGAAHPGDKNPPLGAVLFWDTGYPAGHVAVYVGKGQVVSNANGPAGKNVYLVDADLYNKRFTYLGWAEPVFWGEHVGAKL
jgi:hypothetical protein